MKRLVKFTLVELLVVIAIIALLTSILLPSFQKAKEGGRQVACAGNMKQIGTAMLMYTADWESYFPGGLMTNAPFFIGLEPYIGIPFYFSNVRPPKSYLCPSDFTRMNIGGYFRFYSYGLNYYCRYDSATKMNRISGVKSPSTIFYMIDGKDSQTSEEGYPLNFTVNTWPFLSTATPLLGGDFRHGISMNELFVDSHIAKSQLKDELGTTNRHVYEY